MNKPDYSDPDLPAGVKESDIDRIGEPNPLTVEDETLDEIVAERDEYKCKYHELLWSVQRVFKGESRHETALRYIRETEKREQFGGTDMEVK